MYPSANNGEDTLGFEVAKLADKTDEAIKRRSQFSFLAHVQKNKEEKDIKTM